MGFTRLLGKLIMGGGNPVTGHVQDALIKKFKTGKPFIECLKESVNETITEDMPGTSHVYQKGKKDGRVQGTVEQANRDKKKFEDLREKHDKDRGEWQKIDREKDKLIDELGKDKFGV